MSTAQKAWADTPMEGRKTVLLRTATILRERSEQLGALATAEMGKPITEAIAEVEKCAWVCEYYAEASPRLLVDEKVAAAGSLSLIRYEPLGTVLAIMPWNYPFWQAFRFIAPTIMAGNAAVLKTHPT